MPDQCLSELIESISVDAYGTEEQPSGFLEVFDEEVALPCVAIIVDAEVEGLALDIGGDERRGLVVRSRRMGGRPGVKSFIDVRFESGPAVASLHAAFRSWLGLKAFPARRPMGWRRPEP
jgi:hypothetical protein